MIIQIIVCIIDYVFPTGAYAKKLKEAEQQKQKGKQQKEKGGSATAQNGLPDKPKNNNSYNSYRISRLGQEG